MKFVDVEGGRLRIDHRGERRDGQPLVVFLHAGVTDRRMWAAQLDTLAADYEVLAYDRRGYGETESSDVAFSQVSDLTAVLDAIGANDLLLVGCSQGGRIALDFSLTFPGRVSGLVLIAPAVSGDDGDDFPHSREVLDLADRIDAAEDAEDLELLNTLEARAWLDGPTSEVGRVGGDARRLFLDMNGIALRAPALNRESDPAPAFPRLPGLTVPVLLVWGELDFGYVIDRCQRLAAALPNSKAVVVPGAAHLPNLEQPVLIDQLLRQFAGEVARG